MKRTIHIKNRIALYLFSLLLSVLMLVACSTSTSTEVSTEEVVITFDCNGGSSVQSQLLNINSHIIEPKDPVKEGFIFSGWFADKELTTPWEFKTTFVVEHTTLYAKWVSDSNTLTVTFNSSGGSSISSQNVESGDLLKEPQIPSKEGFAFSGWFTSESLQIEWDFTKDTVTKNFTLYAKWVIESKDVTVEFDSNGGSSIPKQVVTQGGLLVKPVNPVKDSAVFSGWYQDQNLTIEWDFETNTVTENVTLYAKWRILTGRPMILEFNTSLMDINTVKLPLGSGDAAVDVVVDWGDGTKDECKTNGYLSHTYGSNRKYTVKISGNLEHFGCSTFTSFRTLTRVIDFGDIGLKSLAFSFSDALELVEVPLTLPSTVTNLKGMFFGAVKFNQDIGLWDTKNVTNMSFMFKSTLAFNGDIGQWDMGNVTNVSNMFENAMVFNRYIGNWNTKNIINMSFMFTSAKAFNQDIGKWNTESVTCMRSLFSLANAFNQDIGDWNVENVDTMSYLFGSAFLFNQDIGNWDTKNVVDMSGMFSNAKAFNQDIGDWNTQNVTNMSNMFNFAIAFNQDIGNWDTKNVTNMRGMFGHADAFNQDISNWDMSNVNSIRGMFRAAFSFNGDSNIGKWNTENISDMGSVFDSALVFNGDIGAWNTQNVTNMSNMFSNAIVFNQDIGDWHTEKVTNFAYLFHNAVSFNQDIGSWNTKNVVAMGNLFSNALAFNSDLSGWDVSAVKFFDRFDIWASSWEDKNKPKFD